MRGEVGETKREEVGSVDSTNFSKRRRPMRYIIKQLEDSESGSEEEGGDDLPPRIESKERGNRLDEEVTLSWKPYSPQELISL